MPVKPQGTANACDPQDPAGYHGDRGGTRSRRQSPAREARRPGRVGLGIPAPLPHFPGCVPPRSPLHFGLYCCPVCLRHLSKVIWRTARDRPDARIGRRIPTAAAVPPRHDDARRAVDLRGRRCRRAIPLRFRPFMARARSTRSVDARALQAQRPAPVPARPLQPEFRPPSSSSWVRARESRLPIELVVRHRERRCGHSPSAPLALCRPRLDRAVRPTLVPCTCVRCVAPRGTRGTLSTHTAHAPCRDDVAASDAEASIACGPRFSSACRWDRRAGR